MLYVAIAIILVAILILYMLVLKSTSKSYMPVVLVPSKEADKVPVAKEVTDKEKMFQTYFPKVEKGITMDYPLKPIGCCPPSKELSKDLPIANIPMCYANQSKTHLTFQNF